MRFADPSRVVEFVTSQLGVSVTHIKAYYTAFNMISSSGASFEQANWALPDGYVFVGEAEILTRGKQNVVVNAGHFGYLVESILSGKNASLTAEILSHADQLAVGQRIPSYPIEKIDNLFCNALRFSFRNPDYAAGGGHSMGFGVLINGYILSLRTTNLLPQTSAFKFNLLDGFN